MVAGNRGGAILNGFELSAAIPEPGAASLPGSGLALAFLRPRRRRYTLKSSEAFPGEEKVAFLPRWVR